MAIYRQSEPQSGSDWKTTAFAVEKRVKTL
jgi:hypothetical protein